jgi:hypothetical protein
MLMGPHSTKGLQATTDTTSCWLGENPTTYITHVGQAQKPIHLFEPTISHDPNIHMVQLARSFFSYMDHVKSWQEDAPDRT